MTWRVGLLLLATTVGSAAGAGGQVPSNAGQGRSGWTLRSSAAADLWFYGLARVGFGMGGEFSLYNAGYVDRVAAAKRDAGVPGTALDSAAAELLIEFQEEQVFQALHFVPLYFSQAGPEEMLLALKAVAERDLSQAQFFDARTRFGVRQVAGTFRDGDHREVLGKFVDVLSREWASFYADYWARTTGADSAYFAEVEARWVGDVAPVVMDFLAERQLDAGAILVSPPLGPEGRVYEGSPFRKLDNVTAIWAPPGAHDPDVSVYAILRELCFSTADESVRTTLDGVDAAVSSRAAVRCGSLLLEARAPEQVDRYQAIFLAAAQGADQGATFEDAYPVEWAVLENLRQKIAPAVAEAPAAPQLERTDRRGWLVRGAPQTDLWFHTLAVIAADQPGPLGLYSADYARRIRDVKQELGIYPTPLDSLATKLRRDLAGGNPELDVFHFVPLYFPTASAEEMLMSLQRVADNDVPSPQEFFRGQRPPGGPPPGDPDRASQPSGGLGPNAGLGLLIMAQAMQTGGARRLLKRLVEAARIEWHVFYRDYWEQFTVEQAPRYVAIQAMWDTLFVPQLGPYLARRRLTSGVIFPSPPVGPEGRIVEFDEYDTGDQIVSVLMPLGTDEPEATVFAFLKELCFLLVDDRVLGSIEMEGDELEDLRRRAAVRCGALILDFYAPTMASRYRRVFLDVVGAEDSRTNEAFDRIYFLTPEQYERLREEVRRR